MLQLPVLSYIGFAKGPLNLRGRRVTPEAMREFISGLGMPDDVEGRLLALTPAAYTGLAEQLVAHLDD